MLETEDNEEDQKEKPAGIVKDGDESHGRDGNEENNPASPAKQGISNVPSIELPNRQKVKSRNEKPNPARVSDRVEDNIGRFWDMTHHKALNEREEQGIRQPESPLSKLRGRDNL